MDSEQLKEILAGEAAFTEPWIYLDLSESVAIMRSTPAAASLVDEDARLKNYVDFFLGVSRRQLYSPLQVNGASEEQCMPSEESSGESQSEKPAPKQRRLTASFDDLQLSSPLHFFWQKVQSMNQVSFKQQMPRELKLLPELSGLPDERERECLCRGHKELVEKILEREQSLECLSFVDSLNPDSPMDACHPLAIGYRLKRFATCKVQLAQVLFKLLNHQIFYCGLRQYLEWQQLNNSNGSCVLGIGSSGNRSARFRLSKRIDDCSMLLQTLVHEMCHAAAFIFNGETAHGDYTRKWAHRARTLLPQLRLVTNCTPSYSYYCRLCRRRSSGDVRFHAKSHLLRCFHCQFELHIDDADSELLPVLPDTPYMLFVRAHYSQCEQSGHSAKMRALNAMYFGLTQAKSFF